MAILSVGDELLGGRVVNTNAAFVATHLADAGFTVPATEVVGDDEFQIADGIKNLCARAEAVVTVGGLGPTPDDVTRAALAGAAGKLLVMNRQLRRDIKKRTRGRAPEQNARMARVPENAKIFPNRIGTAAGLRVSVGGTPVYSLPGVPMEMEVMLTEQVIPDLVETVGGGDPIPMRVLRVFGPREAEVAQKLGELLDRKGTPVVGVTVSHGEITISIVGEGADERAEAVRARLKDHVYGEEEDTLGSVSLDGLRRRELGVAVAESLTGGLVADMLVAVPGASDVFRGGVLAYSDAVKHELLGVPKTVLKREGAVSETVAVRMARGVRKQLDVEIGVAATGVAGPDRDEHQTPVGRVFVAVAGPKTGPKHVVVKRFRFGGDRNAIRKRAARATLDLLRRRLSELPLP